MNDTGLIQVHTYASRAQIPIKDAAIAITDTSGSAIALRLTNRSGMLDNPVAIEVPPKSASETPNSGIIPFTSVNLSARKEGYEEITITNLQVFANTVTVQDLELIPLPEFPESFNRSENFSVIAQNL